MSISPESPRLLYDGLEVMPLRSTRIIDNAKQVISEELSLSLEEYCYMPRETFHSHVEKAQLVINEKGILRDFLIEHEDYLQKISRFSRIHWVSVLKLRAIRPISYCGFNDSVPFHRETLYANYQMSFQHNVWIPIDGVDSRSSLKYYPKSHMLLDSSLEVERDEDHPIKVERFSSGHRIGYPYSPKLIHKTKELQTQPSVIKVSVGEAAVFSAMLVHGGGVNTGSKIRFSVDTGFIPSEKVFENKHLFASQGKPHYLPLSLI